METTSTKNYDNNNKHFMIAQANFISVSHGPKASINKKSAIGNCKVRSGAGVLKLLNLFHFR